MDFKSTEKQGEVVKLEHDYALLSINLNARDVVDNWGIQTATSFYCEEFNTMQEPQLKTIMNPSDREGKAREREREIERERGRER